MIATHVSILLIPSLLVCGGVIVIFGLLLLRRPVIGALGIAAMVLCIVLVALAGARTGRFTGAWPRLRWVPAPVVPKAPILPEARPEAPEGAITVQHTMTCGDETSVSVRSERSHTPSVSVKISDRENFPQRILPRFMRGERGGSLAFTVVMALAIAAFLGVGYVFLDAATRGQFTWRLRIAAVVAFAAVCVAMASLR